MTAHLRFMRRIGIGFLAVTALAAAPLAAVPSQANTAGTGVVINEVYLSGGQQRSGLRQQVHRALQPGRLRREPGRVVASVPPRHQ